LISTGSTSERSEPPGSTNPRDRRGVPTKYKERCCKSPLRELCPIGPTDLRPDAPPRRSTTPR
jgi:hypothetical protein